MGGSAARGPALGSLGVRRVTTFAAAVALCAGLFGCASEDTSARIPEDCVGPNLVRCVDSSYQLLYADRYSSDDRDAALYAWGTLSSDGKESLCQLLFRVGDENFYSANKEIRESAEVFHSYGSGWAMVDVMNARCGRADYVRSLSK